MNGWFGCLYVKKFRVAFNMFITTCIWKKNTHRRINGFLCFFLFIIFNCFWICVVAQQRASERSKRNEPCQAVARIQWERQQTKRLCLCDECKSKAHTTITKQINQSATVYTSVSARRELIATWLEYGVDYICHIILSNSFDDLCVFLSFFALSLSLSPSRFYLSLKFLKTRKKSARISAENS